jgi:hypothetical protein
LIGTAITNVAGNATISFDPDAVSIGEAQLCFNGYNRPVEIHPLQVVTSGYYVTVSDHSIYAGNDNIIEFGENALLSLTLEEISNSGDIHNVEVEITLIDDYITINDNIETFGTIPSGGTVELIDAFDFDVDNDIPDEYSAEINIIIISDEGDWESQIDIVGYNAELEILSVEVIDGENGVLDPGETAQLSINVNNSGGADLYNLIPSIVSSNPNITITNIPMIIDSVNTDETANIVVCSVEVDDNIQLGDEIDFSVEITADNDFSFTDEFALIVGISIEDFESGDFTMFAWQQGGDSNWVIDGEAYEGNYSAKTGVIGNNSTTSLSVEIDVALDDEISFWKKVSTEANYDYFKFFIDDILQEDWSGEVEWSESSYAVNSGLHSFKWEYVKDVGVTGGDDCAWLDYITFPPIAGEVANDGELVQNVSKLIGNYPNPFNPVTTISFSVTQTYSFVNIDIFNIKGQKIKQLEISNLKSGINNITWDGKNNKNQPVASGIYFYQLNIDKKVIASKKCLLLK